MHLTTAPSEVRVHQSPLPHTGQVSDLRVRTQSVIAQLHCHQSHVRPNSSMLVCAPDGAACVRQGPALKVAVLIDTGHERIPKQLNRLDQIATHLRFQKGLDIA